MGTPSVLELFNYALSPYALAPLLVGSLIFALGLVVLIGERGSRVSVAFWLMTASASLWLLGYAVVYTASETSVALWWIHVLHLGVVWIPTAIYAFTLTIVDRWHAHRWWVAASAVLSVAFSLSVFLTPWFIAGVFRYPWGYYSRYGPLSLAFLAFFFILMAVNLRLYWAEYRRATSPTQRQRLKTFLAAFGIGYLASIDYLACYGVAVYPIGYLPVFGFILLSARAIWRYRLVDFTPAFAADQIVSTMNDALVVCDSNGVIRLVNAAACQLFRYDAPELIGKPFEVLVEPVVETRRWVQAMVTHGATQDQATVFVSRSGEHIDVSLSIAQLRQAGIPRVVGAVVIARDIRSRKRAERKERALRRALEAAAASERQRAEELHGAYEELKQTQAMLIHSEKMAAIGQLASGVAHEVRNPLNVILMGVEYLERLLAPQGSGHAETLTSMKDAVKRANKIIRGMLDFSRPTQLQLQSIAMASVIDTVLGLVGQQGLMQKVEVARDLAPDLPPVLIDKDQMEQVLLNLILNAFQAMPDGGRLTLRCTSRRLRPGEPGVGWRSSDPFKPDSTVVQCEVIDTGVGIPPAHLAKIFDPFFTSKPPGQGTGLGLTISRVIVEQHRGRLTVASEAGRGTTARLMLPSASEAEAKRRADSAAGAPRSESKIGTGVPLELRRSVR